MATAWYDYALYSDYPATSYHNTDVGTPVDTALTAPLSGTITADTYQAWGGQITVRADDPSQIGGIPYYFLIHMDAINPNLAIGQHVNQGDFLGYSGGQLNNNGLPSLPAGYSHHATSPAHSTGPHLDIGVTTSSQGSMDTSKTWSDRLVQLARQFRIASGTNQNSPSTTVPNPPQTGTKGQWAVDLLQALGNSNPDQAQIEFVAGWEHAESGASGGAQNNPLNTEESHTPGVISDFNPAGVKNYDTYQHGIQAEAKVLQNGLYGPLLQALQTPGAQSDAALGIPGGNPSQGVIASLDTWGTHDWNTIYGNLTTAETEAINTTGQSGICTYCDSLPETARPLYCAFCQAAATVTNTANSLVPAWLQTAPWQNSDLLKALARAGFMVLGGALILAGGFVGIKSLGEATGATEKIKETASNIQQKGQRAAEAVATEGASEVERAATKGSKEKKPAKSKGKAAPAKKAPGPPAEKPPAAAPAKKAA